MLSPGEWHRKVPRDPVKNMKFRRTLMAKCIADKAFRDEVKLICAQDILFYVNSFVFQHNPNLLGKEFGPFATWDFQDEAFLYIIQCISDRKDLVIEKSRELGASWMVLIAFQWVWMFYRDVSFLCVSRSEDAVESHSPASLFWKLDFINQHLPAWLLPCVERRDSFIGNLDRGSSIVGEASTERTGVGGRFTAAMIDEYGKFQQGSKDVQVYHSTADTTMCRIFVSTHYGTGTQFYKICNNGYTRKLVMHWSQHPEKGKHKYRWDKTDDIIHLDPRGQAPSTYEFVRESLPTGGPFPGVRSPWYDEECRRRQDARFVAEHLDIDPAGSVAQFFSAAEIRTLRELWVRPPVWQGDVKYDRDTGRPEGLIQRESGALSLWLYPDHNGKIDPGPYVLGADVATGNGSTNSTISIVHAEKGEKVGEYACCTVPPELFACVLMALGYLFEDKDNSPARICWEDTGPGLIVGSRVTEYHYPTLYYRRSMMDGRAGLQSSKPGWVATADNRRKLLDEYRAAVQLREFVNPSDLALRECLDYHYTSRGIEHPLESRSDDPTGARSNHGDRVIADALAWMLVQDSNLRQRGKLNSQDQSPVGSLAWRRELHQFDTDNDNKWGHD